MKGTPDGWRGDPTESTVRAHPSLEIYSVMCPRFVWFVSLIGFAGASSAPSSGNDNVLLLIADDMGVDHVAAYGEHPDPGLTPNIDQLAAEGVLFRNCWSNPWCSATRATIFTGRYSFRTGVGWYVNPWRDEYGLLFGERTLPSAVASGSQGTYATALIGKWHLAGAAQGSIHPNTAGWHHYRGQPNNLVNGQDYWDWERVLDGSPQWVHGYATTETVNDALQVIDALGDTPWFLGIGFHAPHAPLHAPPEELHDYELSGDPNDTPFEHGKAMVQAMDTEIGRLLAGIDPEVRARTTVIFTADNGTTSHMTRQPFDPSHGKPTLFEGGINVPLIVAGGRVSAPGTECTALVNTTDLFLTICEITEVPPLSKHAVAQRPLDSVSLLPYLSKPAQPSRREFAFAERFNPLHGKPPFKGQEHAIRNDRYKLIVDVKAGEESFYDLATDPFETVDLLDVGLGTEEQTAYEWLHAALAELLASW